jgi:integrase/recombinase XerD
VLTTTNNYDTLFALEIPMKRQQPMTDSQLVHLKSAAANNPRDRALIALLTGTAMRASEATALQVAHVNFKDNTLAVQRLKGSVSKVEAMPRETREALEAWLAVKPQSDYVFPGRFGQEMTRQQLYNIYRAITEKAGVPQQSRSPHGARHTIGQKLAEAGATMQLIQSVFGHKNANSSAQYFELRQSSVDEQKARLLGLVEAA